MGKVAFIWPEFSSPPVGIWLVFFFFQTPSLVPASPPPTGFTLVCALFKISLALERNEELIKRWKCGQLRYFRSDSQQGIGQNIWRFLRNRYLKVLAFLFFKFNIFMFSLIWHQICTLDNWTYSTGVHWIFSLTYNLDVDSRNCLLACILFYL